jgi:hypothetical protein
LNPFSWLACFFLEEILPKNKLKEYLQWIKLIREDGGSRNSTLSRSKFESIL